MLSTPSSYEEKHAQYHIHISGFTLALSLSPANSMRFWHCVLCTEKLCCCRCSFFVNFDTQLHDVQFILTSTFDRQQKCNNSSCIFSLPCNSYHFMKPLDWILLSSFVTFNACELSVADEEMKRNLFHQNCEAKRSAQHCRRKFLFIISRVLHKHNMNTGVLDACQMFEFFMYSS